MSGQGYRQESSSALRAFAPQHPGRAPDGTYYSMGYVVTRWGVVGFYTQDGDFPQTSFDVARGGRYWRRTYERHYQKPYIIRLAKAFAREMALPSQRSAGDAQ